MHMNDFISVFVSIFFHSKSKTMIEQEILFLKIDTKEIINASGTK